MSDETNNEGNGVRAGDSDDSSNASDAKRANLVRRLIMILVFGMAIAVGYFVDLPVWDLGSRKDEVEEKSEEEIREAMGAQNQLTVLNAMVDGNPDSEKLKKIIEELRENKYGEQVEQVDMDVEEHKVLAEEHAIDLEEFAGQLDFYSGGQKLGTLKGVTDPVVVEKTIDRYLDGLVKRFGPDWLPKVDGMTRANPTPGGQVPSVAPKPSEPTGVPGMQKVGGTGVPGMQRAKPGESNIQVEPAEKPKE